MLVLWKILKLVLNTLTADDKYSLLNRNNLTQPIQLILSQKRKPFFQFFLFLVWEKSILVLCKVLRLLVNTLTVHNKCSLLNRDNLTQPIQILLSEKQKTFSQFFSPFWKYTLNFEHFQKKDGLHSRCISGITVSKKGDQIKVWKNPFYRTLRQETWETGPNTVEILATLPLSFFLISENITEFEKVYVSAIQNLKPVC